MYDNNESYIAVEQPKNLIVWKNILKKAQKKFHIDKISTPPEVYHESTKKNTPTYPPQTNN